MSEQLVTEPESTCITGAPKPKSYGQVGYEAMLASYIASADIPGQDSAREWALEPHNQWENQPQKLRDEWEIVGVAIVRVFGDRVIEYCERNKGATR